VTTLDDLLSTLKGAPALPNASCRDRTDLFDRTIASEAGRVTSEILQARKDALSVCAGCPELEPCRRYLDALPPRHRPRGVVAGRTIESPRKKVSA
jgi:hypothetical protein